MCDDVSNGDPVSRMQIRGQATISEIVRLIDGLSGVTVVGSKGESVKLNESMRVVFDSRDFLRFYSTRR